jgi:transcriptional regulator with XRE-family HTH domain
MEDFYPAFGQRLAHVRRRAGISQELLAGRVGLSRTSIVNVEKGRQRVPLHMLVDFADVLGVTPDDLLPPRSQSSAQSELPKELRAIDEDAQAWVMRQINRDESNQSELEENVTDASK